MAWNPAPEPAPIPQLSGAGAFTPVLMVVAPPSLRSKMAPNHSPYR